MRINISPFVVVDEKMPPGRVGAGMPKWERFRICEVPPKRALLPHHGLADAITLDQVSVAVDAG
jgi:hypothetical protein